MIDVGCRRCAHQSCNERPIFGVEGGQHAESRGEDAEAGMVNVEKRCAREACKKIPCSALESSQRAEYCGEHPAVDMVNAVPGRCAHESCHKQARFAVKDSKNVWHSSQHAQEGIANISKECCGHMGCNRLPPVIARGSNKRAAFCLDHALEDTTQARPRQKLVHATLVSVDTTQVSIGVDGDRGDDASTKSSQRTSTRVHTRGRGAKVTSAGVASAPVQSFSAKDTCSKAVNRQLQVNIGWICPSRVSPALPQLFSVVNDVKNEKLSAPERTTAQACRISLAPPIGQHVGASSGCTEVGAPRYRSDSETQVSGREH